MRLHTSSASPFGRKVKVVAIEAGVFDRLELLNQQVTPIAPNEAVVSDNPLGKIPCLVTQDGTALYDSRVIAEYLDALRGGSSLFPRGPRRWPALTLQALADGMMEASLLARYEQILRSEAERSEAWMAGQLLKVGRALDRLEMVCASFELELDIGQIAVGCALGYLDFRFAHRPWRDSHPQLAAWYERIAARESFQRTRPG